MKCPICNKNNVCGVEAGQSVEACWCSKAVFPQEIFKLVPPEELQKSCICQACLDKFNEANM